MRITTAFQYLNAFEARRRALAALEVARNRLSPVDFAIVESQLLNEVSRIDLAIGAFQERLVNGQILGLAKSWHSRAYGSFQAYGNALFPNRATISWGSRATQQFLVGYPGSQVNAQLCLQL